MITGFSHVSIVVRDIEAAVRMLADRFPRPDVRYDASGFRGHLTVEEPSHTSGRNRGDYSWDLRLNDEKPLDLHS